jgi:hypothetical protein
MLCVDCERKGIKDKRARVRGRHGQLCWCKACAALH